MTTIANPIYDIVFKYLMDDERIARTILSALLKKEVLAVEVRPQEYIDDRRDSLSVFRIDFGATVREADGSTRLILIELQKTWLETETLRFRRYLSLQYSSPKNMRSESSALPMVAVYLLGHRVGDIEEPVIYVSHQASDYNGNPVTRGIPNAFVESLTHDSIIVQIPLLHGQINNRLDKVLSIFDQSRMDTNDPHKLCIDDGAYADDEEMEHIVHQLTKAVADSELRMRMNVEDEFFSVIEKRDTQLRVKDEQIEKQQTQLDEQRSQLDEQEQMLRSLVAMLKSSGKSVDEIAKAIGKDAATVQRLMAD